jgi:hypothetical protein
MMQTHFLADEHRRELVADARSHQGPTLVAAPESAHECGDNVPQLSILSATQRSAAGIPVTGGRAVRRAMAPRIGAWLIHFGIRLGGATVRTS